MVVIGHTIQVLHVLAVLFVAYAMGRDWGAIAGAWILLVVSTNWICGACPVTLLANLCFRLADAPEYPDVMLWMAAWMGHESALALGPVLFFGSVGIGFICRWSDPARYQRREH